MKAIKANVKLDAKGLACPMPIVKTRKAMNDLEAGFVLEVQATDRGSKADIEAWADSSGNQYLGTLEEDGVLKHYLRKSPSNETFEKKHPKVVSNEELEMKLRGDETLVILDVREAAEYEFNHIPSAISIPLGELESRLSELNKQDQIFVVCSTASRSDLAAQKLTARGFTDVSNVVPGMSQWSSETTGVNN